MSLTSPPSRPRRVYKIGQAVEPAPKPRIDVRPAHWADSKQKGPRGVFTNGKGAK